MTKTTACFLVSIFLFGCEKWDTTGVGKERAELDTDCNCKAPDNGVDPGFDRVDLSGVDLVRGPAKGPADARVTLVVFSDFECPFCRRLESTLSQLETTYGSSIRIVFKELPLPFHEHARLAAKASLVAQDQGKFWPFHDALMADRTLLDEDELERVAESVGVVGLRAELESPELEKRVERDLDDAHRVGARGTPTVLVNDTKIVGAQPYETFAKAIDAALRAGK
jgi:protein-disulfide isomerase